MSGRMEPDGPDTLPGRSKPDGPENMPGDGTGTAGDAAYELVIRTMLVRRANQPVHRLHRQASSLVKAEKQSEMAAILEPLLTEEELQVYRRGRNARANTHARSAGIQEYRRATGFEAVIGFLWLSGQKERMLDLIAAGLQIGREELQFEK